MKSRFRQRLSGNILDYFLMELAASGNKICKAPTLSSRTYTDLCDLVYRGKKDVLELIQEGKPYYPFILLAYYILFHRFNLDIAISIHEALRKAHEKYRYSFDGDEECAYKVLDVLIQDLQALRSCPREEYEGRLSTELEKSSKIEKIVCPEKGWSELFRLLILSHLRLKQNLKSNMKILEDIRDNIASLKEIIVEEEIADAYNLAGGSGESAVYYFLEKTSNNVIETMKKYREMLREKYRTK